MSLYGLQTLIWQAVVSDDFRKGVLNGQRAELITSLDLEADEAAQVMAIQTGTLPEFANGVLEIMHTRYPRPVPPWLERVWNTDESATTLPNL